MAWLAGPILLTAMGLVLHRAEQFNQAAALLDRDSVAIYSLRQRDRAALEALGARLNRLPTSD
ncbi:hypothetical protein BFW89_27405 [Pseudomonas synxantha]|nr:hypothetical protein BFW89_27405 [Pseudomonas synxantha]VCU67899.1 Hypothetical protein [Pseudomonas synxantha]